MGLCCVPSQMINDWRTQREASEASSSHTPAASDVDDDDDEKNDHMDERSHASQQSQFEESFFPLLSRNARQQLKLRCGVTVFIAQSMMSNKMWRYTNWPGSPAGPAWFMCTDHVTVVHCQGNHESILRGPTQGGDLDIIVPFLEHDLQHAWPHLQLDTSDEPQLAVTPRAQKQTLVDSKPTRATSTDTSSSPAKYIVGSLVAARPRGSKSASCAARPTAAKATVTVTRCRQAVATSRGPCRAPTRSCRSGRCRGGSRQSSPWARTNTEPPRRERG